MKCDYNFNSLYSATVQEEERQEVPLKTQQSERICIVWVPRNVPIDHNAPPSPQTLSMVLGRSSLCLQMQLREASLWWR